MSRPIGDLAEAWDGDALTADVVIPSVGRPEVLRTCLEALVRQTVAPSSVVVVVRPTDPATRLVAESFGGRLPVRISEVDAPGLAAAIQRGIETSRGAIIALTDDDAAPLPDWVSRILAAFERESRLGALGGRDRIAGEEAWNQSGLVGRITRTGRFLGNHHLPGGLYQDVHQLKGVNMSFRRSVVEGVPLGEWVWGSGAQQGNELFLCQHVRRQGFRVVYDPNLVVQHFPAPRVAGDERTAVSPERMRQDVANRVAAVVAFSSTGTATAVVLRALVIGSTQHPGLAVHVARSLKWPPQVGSWRLLAAVVRGVGSGLRRGVPLRRTAAGNGGREK